MDEQNETDVIDGPPPGVSTPDVSTPDAEESAAPEVDHGRERTGAGAGYAGACRAFDRERALAYLRYELTDDEAVRFRNHIDTCPECRRRTDELRPLAAGAAGAAGTAGAAGAEPYTHGAPHGAPRPTPPAERVRFRLTRFVPRRAAVVVGRGTAILLGVVLLAASAVLLFLTARSQTHGEKTPEIKYAPPAPIRPAPPRSQSGDASAPGQSPSGVDMPGADADDFDDEDGSSPASRFSRGAPRGGSQLDFGERYRQTPAMPVPPVERKRSPAAAGLFHTPVTPPDSAPAAGAGGAPGATASSPAAAPPADHAAPPAAAVRPPVRRAPTPSIAQGKPGEIRRVADKSFRRDADGSWVDTLYKPDPSMRVVEVTAGGPEAAKLLDEHPELGPYFRFADAITVVFGDTVYRVKPAE